MASGANLRAAITLDKAHFERGLSGAISSAKDAGAKIASGTASAISNGLKMAGKIAIGTAIAGLTAGGLGIGKAIGKAAEMEGFETQFETLLGSAEKAKARMAELAEFGAKTPFNLPEVVNASKILQTMTGDALSTGKGLELVGDVAAATNTPFSELAVTMGRLYDGLNNGRPVGEALSRLQEIGAISGKVRGEIEKLSGGGGGASVANASKAQFETILGSGAAAEKRLKDINAVAKQFKMESGDIGKASLKLEAIGASSLAAGKGLKALAAVAQTTGTSIESAADTLAGLKTALEKGEGYEESIQKLREMGLVSKKTQEQMMNMAKNGNGEGAWKVMESNMAKFTAAASRNASQAGKAWALAEAEMKGRFGGGMAKMAQDWNGMMSNFGDTIDQIFVAIGTPIMNALKPALKAITDTIGAMKERATEFGETLAHGITVGLEMFKQGNLGAWLKDAMIVHLANVGNFAMTMITGLVQFLGNILISGAIGPAIKLLSYGFVGWGAAFAGALLKGLAPFEKLLAQLFRGMSDIMWKIPGLQLAGHSAGKMADTLTPVFSDQSVLGKAAHDMEQTAYGMMTKLPEQVGLLTKALGEAITKTKLELTPSTAFNGFADPARNRMGNYELDAERAIKARNGQTVPGQGFDVGAKTNAEALGLQKSMEAGIQNLLNNSKSLLDAVTGRVATAN